MTTPLGQFLIFELNGGRPRPLQFGDSPLDIRRIAKTGVGIDNHRDADTGGQPPQLLGQFGKREQPNIGQREHSGGKRGPRQIHRCKAHLFD